MTSSKRIAIVTGGGSGIGEASGVALAADGFTIVMAGRTLATLDAAVAEISKQGGTAMAVQCDVSDEISVRNLFAETKDSFGRLDLLFNNAGTSSPDVLLEDLSLQAWSSVVATNLTGMFLCTREAFRLMKAQNPQGGRIINNGSISAHVPRANSAPYTATKHAITGLTKSTSLDGRKYHIACGQIDVGNASTDLMSKIRATTGRDDGSVPDEPEMDVADVARAITYMASLPLEANVQFMTVMATNMPYIGRG
jgi:NAD(P)-dependent dehydrogenase (short-subunit alcohol dehydrogenase family)